MNRRIVDIDIGNSYCKWLLREGLQILHQGRVANAQLAICDALRSDLTGVDAVNVCCVAKKALLDQLDSMTAVRLKLLAVKREQCGLTNSYTDVSQMGADRWLASLSAHLKYRGQPLCIVDCGSAINIEFIDANAQHTGGYIVPGLSTMRDSLLHKTAQVKVADGASVNSLRPGLNTADNVVNGTVMMVLSMLKQLLREILGGGGIMVLTGGDSVMLSGYLKEEIAAGSCKLDSELVLHGFMAIEREQQGGL